MDKALAFEPELFILASPVKQKKEKKKLFMIKENSNFHRSEYDNKRVKNPAPSDEGVTKALGGIRGDGYERAAETPEELVANINSPRGLTATNSCKLKGGRTPLSSAEPLPGHISALPTSFGDHQLLPASSKPADENLLAGSSVAINKNTFSMPLSQMKSGTLMLQEEKISHSFLQQQLAQLCCCPPASSLLFQHLHQTINQGIKERETEASSTTKHHGLRS